MDVAQLKREVEHLIAIQPHALEFLDAVRATGRRMVLVTNAHPDSLRGCEKITERVYIGIIL